jgi:hypothetical protein
MDLGFGEVFASFFLVFFLIKLFVFFFSHDQQKKKFRMNESKKRTRERVVIMHSAF